MQKPVLIIAEAGVNHNGDLDLAVELVDRAAEAGADMVKFQTFRSEALAAASADKAAYQKCRTGAEENQLDMLKRLELPPEAHRWLIERCSEKGIGFLSTPFELESLNFLTVDLKLGTIKLGSGELTNAPLLLNAAKTDAKIILSTGMGTLAEVEEALGVLAFGMTDRTVQPSRSAFSQALFDRAAWDTLHQRVTLLHCTTDYPAPIEDTNLRVIKTMQDAFGLPVGYSDHTEGVAVSLAAVARGACVIEKHFTLDRSMDGPDHAASIEPGVFRELTVGIRQIERAMGTTVKQPSPTEILNRPVARKSLCAARDLPAGKTLEPDDLVCKRPGHGLSPFEYWDAIGRTIAKDLSPDSVILPEDLV